MHRKRLKPYGPYGSLNSPFQRAVLRWQAICQPFQIDGIVDAFLHGVIGTHLLNVTSVTTRAAVDNDDFVVRTVLGTLTVESDCYCHINYK